MPRPGWDASCDWQGFIPFEALPRVYNPPGGAIVTANHAVVTRDYPHHLTFEWAAGFRAERIMERLAARPRHDLESFRSLQQDRVSPFARALLPRLRSVALDSRAGPLAAEARRLLDNWEGDMDPERPEPLIFHAWIWEFARLATADELGPLQREAWGRKGAFVLRILESAGSGATTAPPPARRLATKCSSGRWRRRWIGSRADRAATRPPGAGGGNIALSASIARSRARPLHGSSTWKARPPAARMPSIRSISARSTKTGLSPPPTGRASGPSTTSPTSTARCSSTRPASPATCSRRLYRNFEARWRGGGYVTIPTRGEAFEADALGRLRLTPR